MRNFLPQKRQILGIQTLYKRFLTSQDASDPQLLQRWLKNWTATPPAAPLFEGAEPPTALSWARRRGPDPLLSDAILHKLFRNEAVRVWHPSTGQIKRVKKETLLPLGARLLFPQKIFNSDHLKEAENDDEEQGRKSPYSLPRKRDISSNKTRITTPLAAPSAAATAAASPLRNSVLFENSELIAINKPPGLAVQGGSGVKFSIDALLPLAFPEQFEKISKKLSSSSSPPLWSTSYDYLKLVHRLDRNVTGVLLLGKGSDATARLAEAFRSKSLKATTGTKSTTETRKRGKSSLQQQPAVEKVYWAVVVGPSEDEGRDKRGKIMTLSKLKRGSIGYLDAPVSALQGGVLKNTTPAPSTASAASAVTRFNVLEVDKKSNIAWLELEPLTGRKHQLRQHCARELGLPILGDGKYGLVRKEPQKSILSSILAPKIEQSKGIKEVPLFLHCRSLKIDIPGQIKGLKITAPVPEIWQNLFSQQGWPLPGGTL